MSETYAVIGLGSIARRHRNNIRALFPSACIAAMSSSGRAVNGSVENADVVAPDVESLAALRPRWVIVASPAPMHAIHAKCLMQKGIPVLIEKPLVASAAELEELKVFAAGSASVVAVAHCLRYMPAARIVKTVLEERRLGNIYNVCASVGQYLPSWRPGTDYQQSVSARPELGGGVLLELSHEFDYLQWMLGTLSVKHCLLRNTRQLNLNVEEIADVVLMGEYGTACHVHLDFFQAPPQRVCQFVGSAGRLDWNLIDNSVAISQPNSRTVLFAEPEWDKNNMYIEMLRDFERLVDGRSNSCVTIAEAACTVRVIDAAKKVAEWGPQL